MDANINTIRQQYPQYNDLSDQALADAFHNKYYSDIPKEDFYGRIGLTTASGVSQSQENGYFSRAAQGIGKNLTEGANILLQNQDRNPVSSGIQVLGKAANAVATPFTEAAASGFHLLPQNWQQGISDAADSIAGNVGSAYHSGIDALAETGAGQAFGDYGMNSPRLQADMQELSDTAKGAASLATVLPIGKAIDPALQAGRRATGSGMVIAGQKLEGMAANQVAAKRADFVKDLILPKQTASTAEDQVMRTTVNNWGTKVVSLSPQEQEIADAITKIPQLSPKNTLQGNFNVLTQEISKEAVNLQNALQATKVIFPKKELISRFDSVINEVDKLPAVVSGNKQAWAKQLISDARDAIAQYPGTPAGMLQARKALDKVVDTYRPRAFDPVTENALSAVLPKVRGVINDFIAEKAPTTAVKESLRKQSLYYKAKDIIQPKAAIERPTMVGRGIDKISNMLPKTGREVGTVLGGAGLAGGAAYLVPPITGVAATGAALYGTGKMLNSPVLKKGAGKALTATGRVIRQ